MKTLQKLFLTLLLLFSIATPIFSQGPPAPSSGVWVIIDTNYQIGTSQAGVTNTKVTYRNTTASLVTGLQFRVFYDKNAFSSVVPTLIGSTTNLDLQYVDNNASGFVTITVVYTGPSATFTLTQGELFNLAFTHVAAATFQNLPTIANLTWTGVQTFPQLAAEQSGSDLALSLHNYGGNFIKQKLTFSGSFVNVTGSPAKNLPLALEKKPKTSSTWSQHASYLTNVSGAFSFTENIDTTYYDVRLTVKGDTMNVGNVISVADAQLINQWVLGTAQPSGFDYYAADVNTTNSITITDAYGVFGKISGRFSAWPNNTQNIKFFSANDYSTVTTNPTTNYTSTIAGVTNLVYNITPAQSSVTFYVVVTGDANRTGYHMARLTPIEVINPANTPYHLIDETVEYDTPSLPVVEVNVPNITVNEGSLVEIPVRIIGGENKIGSLQLALYYDSDLVEFKEVKNSEKAMNWLTFTNDYDNIIEWGGYDTRGDNLITNDDVIFTLLFLAKSPQYEWANSALYTSRKFVGNDLATDMVVTPTNGLLQIKSLHVNALLKEKDIIVFPNPTKGEVLIQFYVHESGETELSFVDLQGRTVLTVLNQYLPQGCYTYTANLSKLTEGVYLTNLITVAKRVTDKTLLLK